MEKNKLRKHIRHIIKEELDIQNEIFGLGKVTMEEIKEKLQNMINDMDASGKKPIQTPMSPASKNALQKLIDDGTLDEFSPKDINRNITGYNGKITALDILNMVKGKAGRAASQAMFRENKDNINETWYRMKVLAGIIK